MYIEGLSEEVDRADIFGYRCSTVLWNGREVQKIDSAANPIVVRLFCKSLLND